MSKLKANKDNAKFISRVYTQENSDNDWVQGGLKVNLKYPNLNVVSDSTSDNLVTTTSIETGENVLLYNSTDGIVKNSNITVNTSNIDATSDVDILKDGSGVVLWKLDGDANDVGGQYDGIWDGKEQYGDGKFGQAAKFVASDNNKITTNIPCQEQISFSFWVNTNRPLSDTDGFRIGWHNSSCGGKNFNIVYGVGQCKDLGCWGCGDDYDFSIENPDNKWSSDGNWHNVVVVRTSKTEAFMYIDGVKQTEYYRHSNGTTLDHWELTDVPDGNFEFNWNDNDGSTILICQVRIFNKALSDEEVSKIYNEEYSLFDMSISGLTQAPEKAWLYRDIKVALDIAQTEQDLRIQDIELTKESSSTTQFIGTSTKDININSGEILLIDNSEIVISDITKENNSGTFRYTITFPEQSQAPETVIVPKKSIDLSITEANIIYENDILTHNPVQVDKTGRTLQYSIQSDKDVQVDKVQIDLKRGY